MRSRSLLAVSLLLGPTYLACQLVDPESDLTGSVRDAGALDSAPPADATTGDAAPFDAAPPDASSDAASDAHVVADADAGPFCLGVDAAVCDGFDQEGPIVAMPAENIAPVICDMGSITVDGGRLDVEHPANNGALYSTCSFEGDPAGAIQRFSLDYDLRYHLGASDSGAELVIVSAVTVAMASPNDAGLEDIAFQLLADGTGASKLVATPYFPDASRSPQKGNSYPSYELCATYSPDVILPQDTDCHVSMAVDAVAVTGAVTITCGSTPRTMPAVVNDPPPPGLAATASLQLGYTQRNFGTPYPDWSLSYDNVLLRVYP